MDAKIVGWHRLISRIEALERGVRSLRKRTGFTSRRVSNVLNNQKHYLRHRAKGVLKRQMELGKTASHLKKRLEGIPRFNVMFSSKKGQRVLLLVSHNQARKLRALAEADLRPILNSKANRNNKKRISLSEKGKSRYRAC